MIVGLQVHAHGQVVRPGQTILEMVPVDDQLVVEAKVRSVDVDNLIVGLEADILFTAFPQRTTPRLLGFVVYVSADRFEDERSGEAYYLARVSVSEAEAARLGERKLHPGIPADVMIKSGAHRAGLSGPASARQHHAHQAGELSLGVGLTGELFD